MEHDDQVRAISLILGVQILERMGKARYYWHSTDCDCDDIYACQTDNARQYREILDHSDAEIEELFSLLGISPEARESAQTS